MSRKLFVDKVFDLVNDPALTGVIEWNEDGSSFLIKDEDTFVNEVIPHHFKHSNLDSFVRQLHHYGFKKSGKEKNNLEFSNSLFLRDRPDLVSSIKRKGAAKSNVKDLKSEVDELLAQIDALKSEKESLAAENETLREKYDTLVSKMGSSPVESEAGFTLKSGNNSSPDSFFGNSGSSSDFVWDVPTVKSEKEAGAFGFESSFDWNESVAMEDEEPVFVKSVAGEDLFSMSSEWATFTSDMDDSVIHSAMPPTFNFRAPSLDLNDPMFGLQELFPVKVEDY